MFKLLTKFHVIVYQLTGGRLMGKMGEAPILLLYTKGKKTGKTRANPLLYTQDRGGYVIIASAGGSPKNPAWYYNLKAGGEGTIQVGSKKIDVHFNEPTGEEKKRLWEAMVSQHEGFNGYKEKTDRDIPVIILTPKINNRE